mgnify:FL=1
MGAPYRIIGDKDTVLGFSFAGVDGDAVTSRENALPAFENALAMPDLVVLILTEPVAGWLDAEVTAHKLSVKRPYIATIADIWGSGKPARPLEQLICEAVGVKLP